jgi:hypothetical protein
MGFWARGYKIIAEVCDLKIISGFWRNVSEPAIWVIDRIKQ